MQSIRFVRNNPAEGEIYRDPQTRESYVLQNGYVHNVNVYRKPGQAPVIEVRHTLFPHVRLEVESDARALRHFGVDHPGLHKSNPSNYWKKSIQKAIKAHQASRGYVLADISSELEDRDLSKLNLSGADLRGANLNGVNLSGADLSGAALLGANLGGSNLSDANLTNANLSGARLVGVNFTGATLTGANLSFANLRQANLTGANLIGMNLQYADMTGANLRDADLSDAQMFGARVTSTELKVATFMNAQLPDGSVFHGWQRVRRGSLLVPGMKDEWVRIRG